MSEEISRDSYSYEISLRAVGQGLVALGVESFELELDGYDFVISGGPESALPKKRPSKPTGSFRLFRSDRSALGVQRHFYVSGMRLRPGDVKRLDDRGKERRISSEHCPDVNKIPHALRMIGAYIDKSKIVLLRIQRAEGVSTVWYKGQGGDGLKLTFTPADLYDLWVHRYKQRKDGGLRPTGST